MQCVYGSKPQFSSSWSSTLQCKSYHLSYLNWSAVLWMCCLTVGFLLIFVSLTNSLFSFRESSDLQHPVVEEGTVGLGLPDLQRSASELCTWGFCVIYPLSLKEEI